MITLRGITWNHSRGYTPLVATSQRYSELNHDVQIIWETRSLQAFGDEPIEKLAKNFDLLIIDHPHVGAVAHTEALIPIDKYLSADFLEDQNSNQVGNSHNSYYYMGHQWGLAIDAASPVASWRQDQFSILGLKVPTLWEEMIDLAKLGYVALPAIPVDSLLNFYSLCLDQDERLFTYNDFLINPDIAFFALQKIKQLVRLCDAKFMKSNPIQVYESLVSDSEREIYCPFAFGYTNYSRIGYCENLLTFGNVVKGPSGKPLRTVIGGTGISISNYCSQIDIALDYIKFVLSPGCQSTLFYDNGGQPGHRRAWLDRRTNMSCRNFFKNTLSTLDNSYMRPRYHGYIYFQDNASLVLYDYLLDKISIKETVREMDKIYKESKGKVPFEK